MKHYPLHRPNKINIAMEIFWLTLGFVVFTTAIYGILQVDQEIKSILIWAVAIAVVIVNFRCYRLRLKMDEYENINVDHHQWRISKAPNEVIDKVVKLHGFSTVNSYTLKLPMYWDFVDAIRQYALEGGDVDRGLLRDIEDDSVEMAN